MNILLAFGAALAVIIFFRSKSLPWPLRIVLLVAVGIVVSALWQPETFEDRLARATASPTPSAPHEMTGCSASRREIEARLKAPSSADWVDCLSTTDAGVQTVRLTVDAQNAYGAKVRSRWVTTVRNNSVESVRQAQ